MGFLKGRYALADCWLYWILYIHGIVCRSSSAKVERLSVLTHSELRISPVGGVDGAMIMIIGGVGAFKEKSGFTVTEKLGVVRTLL